MATQRMLIDAAQKDETRVALVNESTLLDFDFESQSKKSTRGNVYLGKIVRIEPSLQAAFVEYGRQRHGFLAFTEIHPDYFRIPVSDRKVLTESVEDADAQIEDLLQAGTDDPTKNETRLEREAPEDLAEEDIHQKYALYRNYKIQEVIKARQVILVQVVKEERGGKGAALTSFISLAGRYGVLMPNALHSGGISRKITENEDRKRLKQLVSDLSVPNGMSLIIRTAGINRTKNEIKKDYAYLMNIWSNIREKTLGALAPEIIYEEPGLISRSLRDIYTSEISEIIVEGEDGYKEAKFFMKSLMPSHVKKIKQYKGETNSLFKHYGVESQIEQIFLPEVKLKSGGYLVINATEALVAIDVNSGRATRERHINTTALKTNLEAAEEVARQVRVRDLSGLIVIDFIDMSDVRHNIAVEKRLKEFLASDRARIQVGRISQFGLLEMSRQRLRSSILEASSSRCPLCLGSGLVRSKESLSAQLLRTLEDVLGSCKEEDRPLTVTLGSSLAFFLLNKKRSSLDILEKKRPDFFTLQEDGLNLVNGFKIENKQGVLVGDTTGLVTTETTSKRSSGKGQNSNNHQNKIEPSRSESSESTSETASTFPNEEPQGSSNPKPSGQQRTHRRRKRRNSNRPGKGPSSEDPQQVNGQNGKDSSSEKNKDQVDLTTPTETSSAELNLKDSSPPQTTPKKRPHPKSEWWKNLMDY